MSVHEHTSLPSAGAELIGPHNYREFDELDLIINVAVRLYPNEQVLEFEDRADIQTVVDTVKSARREAEADGKILADRELYVRARKLIDLPESETDRDSPDYRSFLILAALMGGKPSGKLPF